MLPLLLEHNINNVVKPGAERDGESAISFFPPRFCFRQIRNAAAAAADGGVAFHSGALTRSSESLALSEIGRKVFAKITPPLQLSEGNQTNYMYK